MPSKEYFQRQIISDNKKMNQISGEHLCGQLSDSRHAKILVLDCRPSNEFTQSHICGAINVTLPTLMLRRLSNGKLSVPSAINCIEGRERFSNAWKTHTIVLCGDEDIAADDAQQTLLSVINLRLHQDGCDVMYLEGGYDSFRTQYPEWCSISTNHQDSEAPILGLQNLRITCGPDSTNLLPSLPSIEQTQFCESPPPHDDPSFPVEILPHLFLGNAKNSTDANSLERHKIRYILNVTHNLPNVFESDGSITYLQIPITDHWSQNLASFFPKAIAFIDEARQQEIGVLVHCLAGISRSVTITLAYLMQKMSMPLNDAYDFVRLRKADISPNFNFMGQLLDFERQLNLSPSHCTCQGQPCNCSQTHFLSPLRTTPDSGVDCDSCDNWAM